jgi:hypothetical protein
VPRAAQTGSKTDSNLLLTESGAPEGGISLKRKVLRVKEVHPQKRSKNPNVRKWHQLVEQVKTAQVLREITPKMLKNFLKKF